MLRVGSRWQAFNTKQEAISPKFRTEREANDWLAAYRRVTKRWGHFHGGLLRG